MRKLWLLVAVLGMSACVHRLSTEMNKWVGRDENALISTWGAPDRTATLSNGSKVLTWSTPYNSADGEKQVEMTNCVRSFTVAEGRVVSWSARGCPSLYQQQR